LYFGCYKEVAFEDEKKIVFLDWCFAWSSYGSCGGEKIVAAMAASLTVTQLRKELTKRALDTTGLKPALVGFFIEPLYYSLDKDVCVHAHW
jgi:hypothetical protein